MCNVSQHRKAYKANVLVLLLSSLVTRNTVLILLQNKAVSIGNSVMQKFSCISNDPSLHEVLPIQSHLQYTYIVLSIRPHKSLRDLPKNADVSQTDRRNTMVSSNQSTYIPTPKQFDCGLE